MHTRAMIDSGSTSEFTMKRIWRFALVRDGTTRAFPDLLLTMFVVIGLALNAWGVVMNAVVVEANDGVMPVVLDEPEIIIQSEGTPRLFVPGGKLLVLADRIRIDFPNWEKHIPSGVVGAPIVWWGKWLGYPLEGGLYIVSIGDACRWLGSLMFLLGNAILIPLVLWRLKKNARVQLAR